MHQIKRIWNRWNAHRGKRLSGVYRDQYAQLHRQSKETNVRFRMNKEDIMLFKKDRTAQTAFDRHYIYHPAWAARIIASYAPERHTDISSTLHFCSVLSAYVPVSFYDYRPAALVLSGLQSGQADLTALTFESDSIASLSCMHTVEHIGLGRYGDAIDYNGDLKAIQELSRVLARGGNLLFVVPVGRESVIHFNGHRIYHPDAVIGAFGQQGLALKEFCLIPEEAKDGGLVVNPGKDLLDRQHYACGCFWFVKPVEKT